ncbi:hypothetical protein [Mesorhizobium sp. NZP2298]|uniref:hypothetical protein n=1 Tax=Mesorhizobium sp. NZP2298 TaxID=2483403 RepID=UPI001555E2D8|nr:hypothetical protein [Mesorhizobium sp. NZP2298]QKC98396.1 hypothetical protein EB231_29940 [Mesorhizobium sp. NZP2298]
MELRLSIEGATPEELARGVAAAEAVFARAGITALQGAEGLFALEGWDIKGFPEDDQPTEDEDRAATVWMEADEAATTACCAGWPEDKVPRHQIMELIDVPRTKLQAEALPDTWPERKNLYPDVVKRLEVTAGPDRQIDFDIAFVLGWVPERPTLDRVEPLSEDGDRIPFFTSDLAQVEEMARKALKDWTIEIDRDPYDAHVFDPAAREDGDELRMAAWRDFDGSLLMEKPPANPAIALTLAMMRGQSMHFE